MNLAIVAGAMLSAAQLALAAQDEIVFVCTRDGADNICTINSTGLAIRQVTFEKGTDALNEGPRWSPDRRRIAFFRPRPGGTDVHVMNSDGTGVTKVTNSDGSTRYRNPAWSPDGRRLAFHSNRDAETSGAPSFRGSDIYVIDVDGSNLRRLTSNQLYDGMADW